MAVRPWSRRTAGLEPRSWCPGTTFWPLGVFWDELTSALANCAKLVSIALICRQNHMNLKHEFESVVRVLSFFRYLMEDQNHSNRVEPCLLKLLTCIASTCYTFFWCDIIYLYLHAVICNKLSNIAANFFKNGGKITMYSRGIFTMAKLSLLSPFNTVTHCSQNKDKLKLRFHKAKIKLQRWQK
jgi:hypothetical protein